MLYRGTISPCAGAPFLTHSHFQIGRPHPTCWKGLVWALVVAGRCGRTPGKQPAKLDNSRVKGPFPDKGFDKSGALELQYGRLKL